MAKKRTPKAPAPTDATAPGAQLEAERRAEALETADQSPEALETAGAETPASELYPRRYS